MTSTQIKATEKYLEYLTTNYTKHGVSLSSQKAYISILKNVRKALKYKGSSIHFCKDVEKVKACIEEKSLSYKISTYSALSKLIKNKVLKKQYTDLIKTLNDEKISSIKKGKYTKKEKENINGMSFEDLQAIFPIIEEEKESIEDKESEEYYNTYQYYILSTLYLKCAFLPRLDYCGVKVIYTPEHLDNKTNQLLVEDDEMTFHFNSFKNNKKKGMENQVFKVCPEIRQDISDWLLFGNNIIEDNLFYNMKKSRCYCNKRFSELIKKCFLKYLKTPLRCNDIRKLKEKSIQTDPNYMKISPEDRDEKHRLVFHSTHTAQTNYNKS